MRFSALHEYRPPSDRNVFVFVCEDEFLIEESRSVWAQAFEGNWTVEKLSVKEFEELEMSRLIDVARTPSLFSQSRAMMVTGIEKLSKQRIEDLGELATVPHSSLKVILIADSPRSIDSWMKAFPNVVIDPLKPADAARWLMDRYRVNANIARYIVENVGTELYALHQEMEKLRTYTGDSRPIEMRDVDVLILRAEHYGPFELDDALLARDYRKAVQVLGTMLDEGEPPLVVLARITRVWRQLFIGKGVVAKAGARDAAAAAGIPAWKAADFAGYCRKFEWSRLAGGFRELLAADQAFKSSSPNVAAYFNVMLWKLLS